LRACAVSGAQLVRPVVPALSTERERVEWTGPQGRRMTLSLEQNALGNPAMLQSKAAFSLSLQQEGTEPLTIGNKGRFRQSVMRYDIDRVLVMDEEKSLVVVIRMTKIGFEGPDVRYMVETVKLP
jgi:predicted secreted protein